MLSPEQRQEFETVGFVRIRGAFSRDDAARMEDRVWDALRRKHGVRRGDRATWQLPLAKGLQSQRTHSVFEPIGGPATVEALDDLLGHGRWLEPKHWGSFLVTFPGPEPTWTVPHHVWHTDYPYHLPTDRICGVLLFSYLGEVPAGTGATLGIQGSPAIVRRFIEQRPHLRRVKMKVARRALMASDPWLAALVSKDDESDRIERFMQTDHHIDDVPVPVRVVELTGEPGDVILGHPWLLHAGSPNCGDRPRLMRVQRLRLQEAVQQS